MGSWLYRLDGGYDLRAGVNFSHHGSLTPPARRFVAIGKANVDMDAARRVAAWPFVDGDVHCIEVVPTPFVSYSSRRQPMGSYRVRFPGSHDNRLERAGRER